MEAVFQKTARDGFLRSFDRAVFTGCTAGPHQGHSHSGHDGFHIGEVEVDQARHDNQIRDALNRLAQDIVGNPECIEQTGTALEGRQQALVRNGDDGVDAFLQIRETAVCLRQSFLAFERKRLCNDGNGQGTEFRREAGDNRRGARTGAAAKTGGHEDHVRAFERFDDLFGVFERGLPADIGIGSGSETFRQFRADLEFDGSSRLLQRLHVGVGDEKIDAARGLRRSCD